MYEPGSNAPYSPPVYVPGSNAPYSPPVYVPGSNAPYSPPVYVPGSNAPYSPPVYVPGSNAPYSPPVYNMPYAPASPIGQIKGGYYIGQSVKLRGGGGTMDPTKIWNIQDMTPEFVTITNDQEDINVVDINDILPFSQGQQLNDNNLNVQKHNEMAMNEMAMNQMQYKPIFPSEMKPPDVNVVVVTGDKNEINGLSTNNKDNASENNHDNSSQEKKEKEKEKKGGDNATRGDNTIRNDNSILGDNSILDFTKSFFIKKMD